MRFTALVLAAMLAMGPACAHQQQLTNGDVAVIGVAVLFVLGTMALCHDNCQRKTPL